MKRFRPFKFWLRLCIGLSVIAAMIGVMVSIALAADTSPKDAGHAKTPEKPAKKQLSGAELYAINCNRCHPERYPTEWTAAQWKTLITHMRVRANLPAAQARKILKYLQEDSGS